MQILGISLIWHFLSIIPATFVYTWLYNNSRGSLLTAVIFHMWLNVSEYIVPLDVYDGVGSGLVVLAIVNWIAAGIVSINFSHQSKSLNT
jgi:membrane protease YdiL (CAAX protease family)